MNIWPVTSFWRLCDCLRALRGRCGERRPDAVRGDARCPLSLSAPGRVLVAQRAGPTSREREPERRLRTGRRRSPMSLPLSARAQPRLDDGEGLERRQVGGGAQAQRGEEGGGGQGRRRRGGTARALWRGYSDGKAAADAARAERSERAEKDAKAEVEAKRGQAPKGDAERVRRGPTAPAFSLARAGRARGSDGTALARSPRERQTTARGRPRGREEKGGDGVVRFAGRAVLVRDLRHAALIKRSGVIEGPIRGRRRRTARANGRAPLRLELVFCQIGRPILSSLVTMGVPHAAAAPGVRSCLRSLCSRLPRSRAACARKWARRFRSLCVRGSLSARAKRRRAYFCTARWSALAGGVNGGVAPCRAR